jgi:hypothetical protein
MVSQRPEEWGGLNCRIDVPSEVVQALRHIITEDVGSREDHLSWCTSEFQARADAAYAELGYPELTFEKSWDVFRMMVTMLED